MYEKIKPMIQRIIDEMAAADFTFAEAELLAFELSKSLRARAGKRKLAETEEGLSENEQSSAKN